MNKSIKLTSLRILNIFYVYLYILIIFPVSILFVCLVITGEFVLTQNN